MKTLGDIKSPWNTQHIATCEKQGKQHKLSDHWRSIKNVVFEKKKKQGMTKKAKILTGIQVLTKDLHPTKSDISL